MNLHIHLLFLFDQNMQIVIQLIATQTLVDEILLMCYLTIIHGKGILVKSFPIQDLKNGQKLNFSLGSYLNGKLYLSGSSDMGILVKTGLVERFF